MVMHNCLPDRVIFANKSCSYYIDALHVVMTNNCFCAMKDNQKAIGDAIIKREEFGYVKNYFYM